MSTQTLLVVGAVGIAGYLYYQSVLEQLKTQPGTALGINGPAGDIVNQIGGALNTIIQKPPTTPDQIKDTVTNIANTIAGAKGDRGDLPQWMQTTFAINDMAKEMLGDVVIGKLTGALINESGQRKMLAEHRANMALQKKQDAARLKLATLETKIAKLEALGKNTTAEAAKARVQQMKLDKVTAVREYIAADKAMLQQTGREKARAELNAKYNADVVSARQNSETQAKLVAKGNTTKPTLGVTKQRIQNKIAKMINSSRLKISKAAASIRLPKFTMRGAIHSGASMFGFLVMAYDLVRMFDPRIDVWKNNRQQAGNPPPVEVVPVVPNEPEASYQYPLCDDVIESGEADGTHPRLCRENRPKPWERLSSSGLMYETECPPGFYKVRVGPYWRCTAATEGYNSDRKTTDTVPTELWYAGDVENYPTTQINQGHRYPYRFKSLNLPYFESYADNGDYIDQNLPNTFVDLPESFFVNLGLRQFVEKLNVELRDTATTVSTDAHPQAWSPSIPYSIDTPTAPFDVHRFMTQVPDEQVNKIFPGMMKWVVSNELNDPDWPYQQHQGANRWGKGEQDHTTNSKWLGDFPLPYTDIGLSIRGGEDLTVRDKIKFLFPDATEDEIESAVVNANADTTADTGN